MGRNEKLWNFNKLSSLQQLDSSPIELFEKETDPTLSRGAASPLTSLVEKMGQFTAEL